MANAQPKEAPKKVEQKGAYNFDQYEKDTLTLPRNKAWDNFKSWKDAKTGDKVQGYIRDVFYRPTEYKKNGEVAFKEQRGITLEQPDGVFINVTIKYLPFILAETDNLRLGDPLTIVFSGTKPASEKSYSDVKLFEYFGTNLPENLNNPTVKELTEKDRKAGGTKGEAEGNDEGPEELTEEESEAVKNF